jgi:hypothetical protein
VRCDRPNVSTGRCSSARARSTTPIGRARRARTCCLVW